MSKLFTSPPDTSLLVNKDINHTLKVKNSVGYYVIDSNFFIEVTKKPNWFHRTMIRLILGWKFVPLNAEGRTRQLLYG